MHWDTKNFLSIIMLLHCALITMPTPNTAVAQKNNNQKTTKPTLKKEISYAKKVAPITIKNGITKNDLGYQKLGWRYPDQFTLTVNGEKLLDFDGKTINQKDILLKNNPKEVVVRYSYTWHAPWPWGTKKGSKTVQFALDPQKDSYVINFESHWKNEERVTISGAKKISPEALEVP